MVTIAAPVRASKAVPRTTAVSAVAVLRGRSADAMYPIKVVVPWEHLTEISMVSLTLRVPRGFTGEVVIVEPGYVLCETHMVEDASLDETAAPLKATIDVVVEAAVQRFPCGAKFADRSGSFGAVVGTTGETLTLETFSRLYSR